MLDSLPEPVQRAFTLVSPPSCPEELLWREVAMRATLDALGHTGTTDDATAHNKLVREARVWFRMNVEGDAETVFSLAGIDFPPVRKSILSATPAYRSTHSTDQDGSPSTTRSAAS